MKFDEIGSEYWKADRVQAAYDPIQNAVYTASGRSAQSLIIASAEIANKRALLPAYTCQHIVEPFDWIGWKVDFYDINLDLTPNVESFKEKLELNPGCIIVEGYYSFKTAECLVPLLDRAKVNGTIIVEDITHSFLNDTQRIYIDADYEFCSLRKWSGISDGGYAISLCGTSLQKPTAPMSQFTTLRHEAREVKANYVSSLDAKTKEEYLRLYEEAEEIIDQDVGLYKMSDQAYDDYIHLDFDFIKTRRRENYEFLLENLKSDYIQPIFPYLPEGVTPIMFPVYIPKHRTELRSYLIENRIYCPIHWPAPVQLDKHAKESSRRIYDEIMSIPCDQRYGISDMERLVSVISSFKV